MTIRQGDIYWIALDEPRGAEPGYRRPHVVIQNNVFNRSRISTFAVSALTSNMSRAAVPGNVLFHNGEAGLSKESVVSVSQIVTVDKDDLVEKIGTLAARVKEVVAGVRLLLDPKEM